MDETTICERGADSNFSHRYNLTNFWYVICGLSYLLKKHKPINIFFTMKWFAICGLSKFKNLNETFGWWGFDGRHHPQQTINNKP